jgi:hypothetical protein
MASAEEPFAGEDRALEEIRLWNARTAVLRELSDASFLRSLGFPVAYLLAHPEVIESAASSDDPETRCTALSFFGRKSPLKTAFSRLLKAVRTDPSPSVRATAVHLMGSIVTHTGNPHVLEILKDIARDSAQDNHVRKSAYLAVTRFDSRGQFIHPDMFNFPDDAEWVFFNGVVKDHRGSLHAPQSPAAEMQGDWMFIKLNKLMGGEPGTN